MQSINDFEIVTVKPEHFDGFELTDSYGLTRASDFAHYFAYLPAYRACTVLHKKIPVIIADISTEWVYSLISVQIKYIPLKSLITSIKEYLPKNIKATAESSRSAERFLHVCGFKQTENGIWEKQ